MRSSPNLPYRRSKIALRSAKKNNHPRTILIALIGNLIIAVSKLVAGLISGSAAMLAESAHSFADCSNEVLLALSLLSAKKPANSKHPFGYGRERYLWALMAAISSFVVGGCVSIGLAIRELNLHLAAGDQRLDWIVLGIAFLADGASWIQSFLQARSEAAETNRRVWDHLWRNSDPILRAVIVEDSAGLIGTALAAGGLLLSKSYGSSTPDALASLLIGVLLAFTAIALARPTTDFLIGRSLPDELMGDIQKLMDASPGVESVVGLQAMFTGPGEVVVMAKIKPGLQTVAEFANAMDQLDHQIRETVPLVADVFVDVTANEQEQA